MNEHFDIIESIKVSTGDIYITSDNFIVFQPDPNLTIQTLGELKENITVYKKLMNGKKLPFITDFSNGVKLGPKEKNLVRETLPMFCSAAFVTTKSVSRVILNLFLQLHKKNPPIKAFNTIKEAKEWSLKFVNQTSEIV